MICVKVMDDEAEHGDVAEMVGKAHFRITRLGRLLLPEEKKYPGLRLWSHAPITAATTQRVNARPSCQCFFASLPVCHGVVTHNILLGPVCHADLDRSKT